MEVESQAHGYLPALYRQVTEKLPSSKLREELSVTLKKVKKEEVCPTPASRDEFDACLIHLMPLIRNNPFGIDIKDKPIYAGDIPLWKPYKADTPTFMLNMKLGKIAGKRLEPGYVMFPMPKNKGRKSKMMNMDITSDDKQHLCPKKIYHALFYVIENSIDRLKALADKEKSRSRMSRRSESSQRANKNTSPTRRQLNNEDIKESAEEGSTTPFGVPSVQKVPRNDDTDASTQINDTETTDTDPQRSENVESRQSKITNDTVDGRSTQLTNATNARSDAIQSRQSQDTDVNLSEVENEHGPKSKLTKQALKHRDENNDSRLSKSTSLTQDDNRSESLQSRTTVETYLPPLHNTPKTPRTNAENQSRSSKRSEMSQGTSDFDMLLSRSSKRSDAADSRQSRRTDGSTKSRRKQSGSTDYRRLSKGLDVNLVPIPVLIGIGDIRPGSKGSNGTNQEHMTVGKLRRGSTKSQKPITDGREASLLLTVPTLTDMMVRKRSDAGAETVNTKRDKLIDDGVIRIPDLKLIVENDEHFLLVVMESGRAVEIIPSIAETAAGPFYVAKPHANDENPGSDMRWRISFAPNEESILHTITSGDKNQRLMAAKLVTNLCQNEWKLQPITQYHIKTVLLHEIDFQVDNTPRWQRLSLDECVKLILLRLLHFVTTKSLPHFFEDEFNLWAHLSDRQFRFMKNTLEKMTDDDKNLIGALRRMRVQPVVFE